MRLRLRSVYWIAGLWLSFSLCVKTIHAQQAAVVAEQSERGTPYPALGRRPPPPAAPGSRRAVSQMVDDERAPAHETYSDSFELRYRSGLLIGGVITLFVSYAVTAIIGQLWGGAWADDCAHGESLGVCEDSDRLLYPIAGPWMALDTYGGASVFFGVTQALGLGLTLVGLVRVLRARPVRKRFRADVGHKAERFTLAAAPLAGGALVGGELHF